MEDDCAEPDATPKVLGRSALARALRTVPAARRGVMGITDDVVVLIDVVASACVLAVDDADPRPVVERFQDAWEEIASAIPEDLADQLQDSERDIERLQRKAARFQTEHAKKVMRRLFGAAAFDRVESGFRDDTAVVMLALRRGMRFALPFAVALDNCLRALSPAERARVIPVFDQLPVASVLEILLEFDRVVGRGMDRYMDVPFALARPTELEALDQDVQALAGDLGIRLSEESLRAISGLNDALVRKISGARDAMEYSRDPISQAANSLIELIDRLLRGAFDDAFVLDWLDEHLPGREGVTYIHAESGTRRPTKRGQALCFAYAGDEVDPTAMFEEIAAAGIVAVREGLQELKHADHGSDAERTRLDEGIAAVEGFIVLVCRLCWLRKPADRLERMRHGILHAA